MVTKYHCLLLLSPKCIRTNFQSSIIYRFLDDLRRGNLRNSVERKIFHYLVNYILNFLAKRHRFIPKVGHSKSTFFSMGKVLCTKKHRIPTTNIFSSIDRIKIVLNFSCYKLWGRTKNRSCFFQDVQNYCWSQTWENFGRQYLRLCLPGICFSL